MTLYVSLLHAVQRKIPDFLYCGSLTYLNPQIIASIGIF
jgi:hypothetical protein